MGISKEQRQLIEELYNKYNNFKKYETLGAYILDDEKHFSIVSMWEV